MPITIQDFMQAAQSIINNGSNEIDFRNSASRAYYAGYHAAKKLSLRIKTGKTLFIRNAGTGLHQQLINELKSNPNTNIKKIGRMLQMCKAERTDADYQLSLNFNKSRAQNVIGMVSQLLTDISNIP